MEKELTKSQLRRQDFVDNNIHWLLTHLAEDINEQHVWNIDNIAKVREVVLDIICDEGYGATLPNGERDFRDRDEIEKVFYPYIEEDWCTFCNASCTRDAHENCPNCGNPVFRDGEWEELDKFVSELGDSKLR